MIGNKKEDKVTKGNPLARMTNFVEVEKMLSALFKTSK